MNTFEILQDVTGAVRLVQDIRDAMRQASEDQEIDGFMVLYEVLCTVKEELDEVLSPFEEFSTAMDDASSTHGHVMRADFNRPNDEQVRETFLDRISEYW